jgi:hypothetical protein
MACDAAHASPDNTQHGTRYSARSNTVHRTASTVIYGSAQSLLNILHGGRELGTPSYEVVKWSEKKTERTLPLSVIESRVPRQYSSQSLQWLSCHGIQDRLYVRFHNIHSRVALYVHRQFKIISQNWHPSNVTNLYYLIKLEQHVSIYSKSSSDSYRLT